MAKNKNSVEKLAKDPMVSLFRKRKLIITLIVLFLLLATAIGLVTYYGLSTGGFTINIDKELGGYGVVLKESLEGDGERSLNAPEFSDGSSPIAQPQINEYYIIDQDGATVSNAKNYIGYTFYLCHEGNKKCDIETTFKITSETKNVGSAARFWLIISKGEYNDDEEKYEYAPINDYLDAEENKVYDGTIYKRSESEMDEETLKKYNEALKNENYYDTVNWDQEDSDNQKIVFNNVWKDFKPNEHYKISIIMWLEGNDPDCEAYRDENGAAQGILNGSLKVGMSFEAFHEKLV